MMRRCSILVVILAVSAFTPACSNYSGTLQSNTGGLISFLAPSDARAGGGDFVLTVNGGGFDKTTVVRWNGQNRTTTFVNSSQVTATITAADITQPGSATVDTFTKTLATGTGYNGLSNTVAFTISTVGNPVPTITAVTPNSAPASSADLQITVTGSNFLQGSGTTGASIVRWNAISLVTKFVSISQLAATVPKDLLLSPGTATITVFNSAPGGGTSPNGIRFTITAAAAAQSAMNTRASMGTSQSASAPAISGNGRFVVFTATATSSGQQDVFVQDTCAGVTESCSVTTTRLSVAADGGDANDSSRAPATSADGRYIAFESSATNLIAGETGGMQIFLRDTCFGSDTECVPSTILVSVDSDGALSGNDNVRPSISASGRFVAFLSITPDPSKNTTSQGAVAAGNVVGVQQVFVRDTCLGATRCTPRTVRISVHHIRGALENESGATSGGDSQPLRLALAGDGRSVVISAPGANVFTPSTPIADRIFVALTSPDR
ncbi:MAG TPA: IPT/TIG domain-containing protein [Candidatus Dormibacteraeota bacterium]|nr:IPT/TIG domain-containing protein [Candidatus Dormibacteraeota bacterium]